MSHEELTGWMAFYQLEPWGNAVEDGRFSLLADLTWAANTSSTNKSPPVWFDRDPAARVKPDPPPQQLEDNIRDYFMGKTAKVTPKYKKPRKTRKKAPAAS